MANFIQNCFDYVFNPWTTSVVERGHETWTKQNTCGGAPYGELREYERDFVVYEDAHKFDGSKRIRKEYLN